MASCPKTDFISEVLKTSNVTPKVFSFNFISAYFEQLISIMAKYNVKNCLLIQSIMNEYLRDIKDCNINGCTMASPFMVTFNIGKNVYVRNKKTVACASKSKNKNVIHFCQILTPKVAFSLEEFNVAETGSTNTFMDLNSMDKLLKMGSKLYLQVLNNCVTLSCTLCNKVYQGEHCYSECMDHFGIVHKGEQEVVCFKCRNKFDVPNLASTRWYHNCQT
nr:uncharacterized protein LOC111413644 [Onthophagus taurus]